MSIVIIVTIGLTVGLISGLLGLGGGAILVPLLVLLLGYSQHSAQGMSLIVIIPTALAAIWQYRKENLVDCRMAAYLAAGAIIGALISSNYAQIIPGEYLKKFFGVFIVIIGLKMLIGKSK